MGQSWSTNYEGGPKDFFNQANVRHNMDHVEQWLRDNPGQPSTPPRPAMVSQPRPVSAQNTRNAALIRQQVELEEVNPGSPRVIPRLHGLDYPLAEYLQEQYNADEFDEDAIRNGDGEADPDVLTTAVQMAGTDVVLQNSFGLMTDLDLTPATLDSPASTHDTDNDLSWWLPVEAGETLREWFLRSLVRDALYVGEQWTSRYSLELPGYGPIILHANAAAFYEDAWFLAAVTPDGIIVGWDAGAGVDW